MMNLARCTARPVMIAVALLLAQATIAGGATLHTHATVVLVEPIGAVIDGFDHDGQPSWSLSGESDEGIHLMVEWRTLDGDPYPLQANRDLPQALATTAVATLVILRE